MNAIQRLQQIIDNNQEPVAPYGMGGIAFVLNRNERTRKRLAAGILKSAIIGRQFVPRHKLAATTAYHLNRVKELIHD